MYQASSMTADQGPNYRLGRNSFKRPSRRLAKTKSHRTGPCRFLEVENNDWIERIESFALCQDSRAESKRVN